MAKKPLEGLMEKLGTLAEYLAERLGSLGIAL